LRQLLAHQLRACGTAAACRREPRDQLGILGVDIQPDDMHGAVRPRDRNFHAADVSHAECLRCGTGFALTADFIVIGERPQVDTGVGRDLRHFRRRKRAVRHFGMTMKICVEHDVPPGDDASRAPVGNA
jgi:hypothetical protein